MSALALASCEKKNLPVNEDTGYMEVLLDGAELISKASSTTSQTYESQVNTVQILAFNSNGLLSAYLNNGTSLKGSLELITGTHTVWAVVNGPSFAGIAKQSDLESYSIDLSSSSKTASLGFIMGGSASVTISSGKTTSTTIAVNRYTSRVHLASIENSLPSALGSITINGVFLCNVLGNQNIACDAAAKTWYNKDGRKDETTRNKTHIIDGSTYLASCPSLTYMTLSENTIACGATKTYPTGLLYCFPNTSTVTPTGFQSSYSPAKTVLCIAATICGVKQYYPVVLSEVMERNKSYSVNVVICGLGSDDPVKPVEKGTLCATVTVSGWSAGKEYNDDI